MTGAPTTLIDRYADRDAYENLFSGHMKALRSRHRWPIVVPKSSAGDS
jgi:hypothetical protein